MRHALMPARPSYSTTGCTRTASARGPQCEALAVGRTWDSRPAERCEKTPIAVDPPPSADGVRRPAVFIGTDCDVREPGAAHAVLDCCRIDRVVDVVLVEGGEIVAPDA